MRMSKRLLALTIAFLLLFGNLGAVAAAAAGEPAYTLSEEVVIQEDTTPLGVSPDEHACCILHFILTLCALAVTVYYVGDRRSRQKREFELRAGLM